MKDRQANSRSAVQYGECLMLGGSEHVGLYSVSEDAKPIRGPKADAELTEQEVVFNGLVYQASRATVPVSHVFTGIAYLRKLAEHRRRVRREIVRLNALERNPKPESSPRTQSLESMKLFEGLKWADLRMANCAKCRVALLGDTHEWIRMRAEAIRLTKKGDRILRNLPGAIAGVIHDRPYCANCLPVPKHGGNE